jgi:hypothetical protein
MPRLLGLTAALAVLVQLPTTPARADQFEMAADNARVPCAVSRRELTRCSGTRPFGLLDKSFWSSAGL